MCKIHIPNVHIAEANWTLRQMESQNGRSVMMMMMMEIAVVRKIEKEILVVVQVMINRQWIFH